VIVAFHRVGPADEGPSCAVTPELFERQVRFLASRYPIVPLDEAVSAIRSGHPLEDDALSLTFDDSYRDHLRHVLPILQEIGVPATVFLTTGPLDEGKLPWYDAVHRLLLREDASRRIGRIAPSAPDPGLREALRPFAEGAPPSREAAAGVIEALKKIPDPDMRGFVGRMIEAAGSAGAAVEEDRIILNWDEARELARWPVSIGSHTCTHPILSRMPGADARTEIVRSRQRLEEALGQAVTLFSYPNGLEGDFTPEIERMVGDAGYVGACTMIEGANDHRTPPWRLRRICLGDAEIPRVDLRLFKAFLR
jgi:peptidoglycan/xylan/chitin deacetylase (PgdA/CDA1 family)